MELSIRLKMIINNIDKCACLADIGTDHGYVIVEALHKDLCKMAIATDINKGPLEKARKNCMFEGLTERCSLRLGAGLKPIKKGEINAAVIAGMGGNLIRDIILDDIDKVKKMDYLILQPAQNPEVIRKFLYNNNFYILNEDLCRDDGKYYECFKVKYCSSKTEHTPYEEIDYEVSPFLYEKKSKLFKEYLQYKVNKYSNIISYIKEDTDSAEHRKKQLKGKIDKIEEMIKNYES